MNPLARLFTRQSKKKAPQSLDLNSICGSDEVEP